jgi:hypothetical protein
MGVGAVGRGSDLPSRLLPRGENDDPHRDQSPYRDPDGGTAKVEGKCNRDGDRGDDRRELPRLHPESFSSAPIAVPVPQLPFQIASGLTRAVVTICIDSTSPFSLDFPLPPTRGGSL